MQEWKKVHWNVKAGEKARRVVPWGSLRVGGSTSGDGCLFYVNSRELWRTFEVAIEMNVGFKDEMGSGWKGRWRSLNGLRWILIGFWWIVGDEWSDWKTLGRSLIGSFNRLERQWFEGKSNIV
jgi:hypothetical protein